MSLEQLKKLEEQSMRLSYDIEDLPASTEQTDLSLAACEVSKKIRLMISKATPQPYPVNL